jgi:hypothetical protein
MHHPRYVLPSSELHRVQTSNELYVLLLENAALRRTATDLALETELLRETLAIGDSGNRGHSDRPRRTAKPERARASAGPAVVRIHPRS